MRMATREWAADKAQKKKFKPRDVAPREVKWQPPASSQVVRLQRPPAPRPADAMTIAAAEVAHRLRFPSRYGLSAAEVDRMRANIDAAIASRAILVRFNKRGQRV